LERAKEKKTLETIQKRDKEEEEENKQKQKENRIEEWNKDDEMDNL